LTNTPGSHQSLICVGVLVRHVIPVFQLDFGRRKKGGAVGSWGALLGVSEIFYGTSLNLKSANFDI